MVLSSVGAMQRIVFLWKKCSVNITVEKILTLSKKATGWFEKAMQRMQKVVQ
jgi:hypothetical protein